VERARWTDERLDDRMSTIDTTFERVFDEMRAERADLRNEMRAFRAELRAEVRAFDERLSRLDDRLRQLDDRLSRIGFRMAGILASGLIALVVTQL
jgi:L-lactate utilization protein LutB